MTIKHIATAGTLESSDALVTIEPSDTPLVLTLSSTVMSQFGPQIKSAVLDVLASMGVTTGNVTVVDNGALDCTLRARTASAVFRGADVKENFPWEVLR